MSLILDALKKSERERHRDKAPGLQSIHQPPLPRRETQSRRHWWLLAAVVAINAGVLGYWRFQQGPTVPTEASTAAKSATLNPSVDGAKREPGVSGAVDSGADEYAKISPSQSSAAARVPAAQAVVAQPAPASDMRIEEVGELPEEIRNNLPAMTFSFHVYSPSPQQRTIIINNRRMREGDEISSGLQLQQITEDGVILATAGHRIHIGVLSGW